MSICCRDLFNLKYFKDAKLLAGEGGLDRAISWPYIRTTQSISQWLHGGELIFITDIGIETDDNSLLQLLEECIDNRLSGMVVLIGNNFINNIPNDMIETANKYNFPLFTIPWDTKLLDISQEIVFEMQKNQDELNNSKHFFESLLLPQEHLNRDVKTLAEFYKINIRNFHYISMIKIDESSEVQEDTNYIRKRIFHTINTVLNQKDYTLVPMEYSNNLLLLIFADDLEKAEKSSESIVANFNVMSLNYSNIKMSLSFSRIRGKECEIKTSYEEASKALAMINISNADSNIIHYKDLGMLRLLIEMSSIKGIEQYCYENLGAILDYDKIHGTDLFGTLKCYFQHSRHLLKTSQELFIHRNTLLYRLTEIKELLNIDLDDAMTNLELFNSILIYEYLKLEN